MKVIKLNLRIKNKKLFNKNNNIKKVKLRIKDYSLIFTQIIRSPSLAR